MGRLNLKQASKSRQQLLQLSRAITRLCQRIVAAKTLTKGSIYKQKKKCGNTNCKCARGELHSTNILSFSEQGRTRLIPLTKYSIFEFSKIRAQVQNYQQYRRVRAEIVNYFNQIISEINKLEHSLLLEVPARRGEKSGKREQEN